MAEPEIIQIGNITEVGPRDLIILSWFPFDDQKHYWVSLVQTTFWNSWNCPFQLAYFLQVIDGIIGTLFVALSDVFIVNLILYPTTQLKKLQYIFRNFEHYQQSYKRLHSGETQETAGIKVITDLVQRHQRIIKYWLTFWCLRTWIALICRYVDTFNGWMGPLMVFDFLQSSIQIASILISDLRVKYSLSFKNLRYHVYTFWLSTSKFASQILNTASLEKATTSSFALSGFSPV